MRLAATLSLSTLLLSATALAAPQTRNPDNGHYYQYVSGFQTWQDAQAVAESLTFLGASGHLATITDLNENIFAYGVYLNAAPAGSACWLGGFQNTASPTYSEPGGGWEWITGEPFTFTAWGTGEPNSSATLEDFLVIVPDSTWNDVRSAPSPAPGYLVEFDVVDAALNPANGNSYALINETLCWDEARAAAEALQLNGQFGHLATITSQSEADFINSIVPGGGSLWLGGFQDTSAADYAEPSGGWRWITGEPFVFTDWAFFEPSNANSGEEYLGLFGTLFGGTGWNDDALCSTITTRYIVEFEGALGETHCLSLPNSTGVPGSLTASGSLVAVDNNMTLNAGNLPPGQFGIFLASVNGGAAPLAAGILCVGPMGVGRYQNPGQIQQADSNGNFSLTIDLLQVPTPIAPIALQAGDTWHFQAWHRDFGAGGATANLTNGLRVTLR